MSQELEEPTERTRLLHNGPHESRLDLLRHERDAESTVSSQVSKEEQALAETAVGERLPYNDYTTIDWLHDLVKDSFRFHSIHGQPGLRYRLLSSWDSCQGWIASAMIGVLTACVAFLVDVSEATVSDWKEGYCNTNAFLPRDRCCVNVFDRGNCEHWHEWTPNFWSSFGIYVGWALSFGVISSSVTMLTKRSLPAAAPGMGDGEPLVKGKSMYMAAGSGIPEIRTILSGFVIPHFLDFKILFVKAVGAVFAVATVGQLFPKYRDNGRKIRELLSAGCASGLSVAFGAPIGGVLFSYEEISTYFPRKVLWRAFLCSLCAAMVLRALNPNGTGKLVLFETNYGTSYDPLHYLIFVILGIAGGIWGGLFCKANFLWSKSFRKISLIRNYPVFEVFLVVAVTALLQYPNPMTREAGDIIIKNLLVDCRAAEPRKASWVCRMENQEDKGAYIGWLAYGTIVKLVLTIITFGCKVPSGIIIPALDAGAFFGRLLGQGITTISPGIFAMVGAAAFLAGVSRMTISLCVIMFELTGELEYVVPHMIAILVAKWVADAIEKEGVYDLAQAVLGHPFLDQDHSIELVKAYAAGALVEDLIPPKQTMTEITVHVPLSGLVPRTVLSQKLDQLHRRGLLDAGLVLVQNEMLHGYLAEGELSFGLTQLGKLWPDDAEVRVLPQSRDVNVSMGIEEVGVRRTPNDDDQDATWKGQFDLSMFVDRSPLVISANAPIEYAVEMFGKLGLRHLMIVEAGTAKLVGVVIKKRLVAYLDGIKH